MKENGEAQLAKDLLYEQARVEKVLEEIDALINTYLFGGGQ